MKCFKIWFINATMSIIKNVNKECCYAVMRSGVKFCPCSFSQPFSLPSFTIVTEMLKQNLLRNLWYKFPMANKEVMPIWMNVWWKIWLHAAIGTCDLSAVLRIAKRPHTVVVLLSSPTPCKCIMHIECIICLCSALGGIMSKGGRFFSRASGMALWIALSVYLSAGQSTTYLNNYGLKLKYCTHTWTSEDST